MKPSPKYKDGMPYCSRKDCGVFCSRVEEGWGIYETCYLWDKEKHGNEPYMYVDTELCRPVLLAPTGEGE